MDWIMEIVWTSVTVPLWLLLLLIVLPGWWGIYVAWSSAEELEKERWQKRWKGIREAEQTIGVYRYLVNTGKITELKR